jgi:hypothetical protein
LQSEWQSGSGNVTICWQDLCGLETSLSCWATSMTGRTDEPDWLIRPTGSTEWPTDRLDWMTSRPALINHRPTDSTGWPTDRLE